MTNKIQIREIVVRQFEDGNFQADVPTCTVDIKKSEFKKFMNDWENGKLYNEDPLNLGKPKILQS